jgi:hypothetical protein
MSRCSDRHARPDLQETATCRRSPQRRRWRWPVWLAIALLRPPLAGVDDLAPRLVFAFTCYCLAVIFCLVTGIEAVAHERLSSPAFDPLSGFETQRLRINQRYLQNTLEQIVVFGAALFGLAVYASDGAAMRAVLVLSSGC